MGFHICRPWPRPRSPRAPIGVSAENRSTRLIAAQRLIHQSANFTVPYQGMEPDFNPERVWLCA